MNKLTQLMVGALALSVTSSLSATGESQGSSQKPAFQGFHIGGNIGYGVGTGHFKTDTKVNAVGNLTNTSKTKLGFDGVDGGLGLGYMHRLNNFVLGAAFDANWSNASGKASASGVDILGNKISMHYKARLKNSLQLYAKLGYVIRETVMPFIGLGWDNSQWERSLNVVNEDMGYRAYQKKTQRFNTGLWKFGFDVLAAKNVIVGFEYTGTLGKNKNHTVPIANNLGSVNTSFKPQYNKFALTTKFIF